MSRELVAIIGAIGVTCALVGAVAHAGAADPADGTLVYIGTYTRAGSEGIYAFRFDGRTGALGPIGLAAKTSNPSFLVVHPNGRWLYAANEDETYEGQKSGAVSAFAIDRASGRLTLLNQQSSQGAVPCHVTLDRTGRYLLVANYTGGSVAVLPIESGGRLGRSSSVVQHTESSVNQERQREPHAHAVVMDETNRFALAADLGTDKVFVRRFDADRGVLTGIAPQGQAADHAEPRAASLPPGSGPRHLAFAPSYKRLYVINELSSTIGAFGWNAANGTLTAEQRVSTLPPGVSAANAAAEIALHPSGRFLYGSNRGHDSIAVFRVDPGSGALTLVEHEATGGRTPRNFAIDPSGRWLIAANQDSNSVVTFRIDQQTGALERAGNATTVPLAVCVTFVPDR